MTATRRATDARPARDPQGPPQGLGRDFGNLWAGQVASMVGSQLGDVAIRLLAALTLAATPWQLGLLSAAQTAAFLLVGLPAGAWVDRMRCRRVMIVADLARAVLLASIPVAWLTGYLTLTQVLVVAFLVGIAHVFFDVAYQAYLPVLVRRDSLMRANARLESTRSAAAACGPALAGVLVQLLRAPVIVAVDAVSYLVSAVLVSRIRTDDTVTARPSATIRQDIGEGLGFVVRHPVLRALGAAAALYNFCYGMLLPLTLLLLVTELGLSASAVGVLFACAGVGGLAGALVARRLSDRLGWGRALILAEACAAPSVLVLALTGQGVRVGWFALGYLVMHGALAVFNVAAVSLRQALCPPALMGRVTASMRFAVSGALPLGGLVGGVTGSVFGARPALVLTGAGLIGAVLVLIGSPIRNAPVLAGLVAAAEEAS